MMSAKEALRSLNREFRDGVLAWAEPYQRAGRIATLPPEVFFAILLGPVQLFCRWWLAERARNAPDTAVTALGDAAWTAIRGR